MRVLLPVMTIPSPRGHWPVRARVGSRLFATKTAVQDADEAVRELPQCGVVGGAAAAELVVVGAGAGGAAQGGEGLAAEGVEEPVVVHVTGVDSSAPAGGAGDGAGAGVVLAGAGSGVAGGVIAELGQHAGGQDGPEAGLAEVDLRRRVAGEERLDLGLHGGDLGAQDAQDRRLRPDHGGVGDGDRRGLAQMRGPQCHPDRGRLRLDVAAPRPPQGSGDLGGW